MADVVALALFGVDAGVVVTGTEVVEPGAGAESRCRITTRSERPTATRAFFLPRRRPMRR